VAAPVVGSLVPLASVLMTLMTQVERAAIGLGIASGGPNLQFSFGWQPPPWPLHCVSDVQAGFVLGPVQAPPTPGQPPVPMPAAKHTAPGVEPPTHVPELTQWLIVALDPLVQSSVPLPLLATSELLGPMSR